MAQSVTLSSVGTASMVLNPVSKSTTVLISASVASSLTTCVVEMSLDDPTIPGGSTTPTWAVLSSAILGTSAVVAAATYTVLSPVGMVRINSTTVTASSATWTLRALQSVTA